MQRRERTLGPSHPEVAIGLTALAALLAGQRKFDEAEQLYHSALAINRRVDLAGRTGERACTSD